MARGPVGASLVVVMAVAGALAAVELPGPEESEWSLTEVEGWPNAPAVVLESRGEMQFSEDRRSSWLSVYRRFKILTRDGADYGSVAIFSTDFFRAKEISGRTHLPGGRVVRLESDATFEKEYSDYYGTTRLTAALPGVVPGAIVEYGYRIYFDSIFYPRPWYFQSELPTVASSITYKLPETIAFVPMKIRTLRHVEMEEEVERYGWGAYATYRMRDLPPVPDEPYRFPFSALASRVLVLPTLDGPTHTPLLDSWEHTVDLIWGSGSYGYSAALKRDRPARKLAKRLTSDIRGARERAAAGYRWVRDGREYEPYSGVIVGEEGAVKAVMEAGEGDSAEQALVLYAMLRSLDLEARLGWTSGQDATVIQPEICDPAQFDDVIVIVDLPDGRVFLDPTDRSLAFGALPPRLQGVKCLLLDRKNQEWTETPQLPAEASRRTLRLDLELDQSGALSGEGSMELVGNHGWRRLQWRSTEDETRTGWLEWLEERFPGYDVSELVFEEEVEARCVTLSWHLEQREEEILGDECALVPARPLAVASNPFTLEPRERMTPVQLSFPDIDVVETTLTWPEGWVVEVVPETRERRNSAGAYTTSVSHDPQARRLRSTRSLETASDRFIGAAPYADLRTLFSWAVDGDVAELVLVAE